MSSVIKNILVFGGLIGIAVFGYYLFNLNSTDEIVETDSASGGQASAEAQEFLNRLHQLERVQINSDIFLDPRFRSLEDFALPIQPIEIGRDNPFATVEPE